MKSLTLFLFSILCAFGLKAQITGLDLLGDKDKVDIPFEYHQGFVVLKIKFQTYLPLNFLFDTGAEHTLLFKKELSDIMGVKYARRVKILGADLKEEIYALIARGIDIELQNTSERKIDMLVLEENAYKIEEMIGSNIDGILGTSFFDKLVMKIDYKKKKLTLINPFKFTPPKKGFEVFDLEIQKHKPYINAKVTLNNDTTIALKLLIDSGASLPFLLHQNTHPYLELPEKYINGNLGLGLGGNLEGYIGKTKHLQVGSFDFKSVLTSYQDLDLTLYEKSKLIRNGMLGNRWLERFEVYYDSFKEKLYLKPRKKKFNTEFDYDKSGLTIIAVGTNLNHFIIKEVVKDSPADEAGLQKGDRIMRMGVVGYKLLTLNSIVKKLKKKNGKKIRLRIYRAGKKFTAKIKLRDLFE